MTRSDAPAEPPSGCTAVRGDDLEIRVKAVPGARRDGIAGSLGDHLKVRVSAPPEGGRANEAIAGVLAAALGVAPREVELVQGATSARKIFVVRGGASLARPAAWGGSER
jgi:uncharacterized protein (TIGR00251 family)